MTRVAAAERPLYFIHAVIITGTYLSDEAVRTVAKTAVRSLKFAFPVFGVGFTML